MFCSHRDDGFTTVQIVFEAGHPGPVTPCYYLILKDLRMRGVVKELDRYLVNSVEISRIQGGDIRRDVLIPLWWKRMTDVFNPN